MVSWCRIRGIIRFARPAYGGSVSRFTAGRRPAVHGVPGRRGSRPIPPGGIFFHPWEKNGGNAKIPRRQVKEFLKYNQLLITRINK